MRHRNIDLFFEEGLMEIVHKWFMNIPASGLEMSSDELNGKYRNSKIENIQKYYLSDNSIDKLMNSDQFRQLAK